MSSKHSHIYTPFYSLYSTSLGFSPLNKLPK
jgi:hypothetical protein